MNHEQAWKRLPDLVLDRDELELLAHVAACNRCQRQLFLLVRVDRALRDAAASRPQKRRRTRKGRWLRRKAPPPQPHQRGVDRDEIEPS